VAVQTLSTSTTVADHQPRRCPRRADGLLPIRSGGLLEAIFPGVIVTARPVGMFEMTDEAGGDDNVLCVPAEDPRWDHIKDIGDVPTFVLDAIKHFLSTTRIWSRAST
jgi:hypothetical protein